MTRASMFLRAWAIGCATVAAMMVLAVVALGAAIARQPARSVLLKPRFTPVAGVGNVGGLNTSGRYVLVAANGGQNPGSSVVIDDQTGAQRQLPTGCVPTALSGVTLALDCQFQESQGQETLYDLQTGQSSTFTFNPMLVEGCNDPVGLNPCPSVSAIGSDWVAITAITHNYHEDYVTVFQNRKTGQIVDRPGNPKLNVDLNTSGLIGPVCSPLAIPEPENGSTYSGSLFALGYGFEIATGHQVYLERCGTHLRMPLYSFNRGYSTSTSGCVTSVHCPPATNARSTVWTTTNLKTNRPQSISGIFVPSLRRFTIKPPKTPPSYAITVALTNEHLYLRVGNKLWRAPAPTVTKHS